MIASFWDSFDIVLTLSFSPFVFLDVQVVTFSGRCFWLSSAPNWWETTVDKTSWKQIGFQSAVGTNRSEGQFRLKTSYWVLLAIKSSLPIIDSLELMSAFQDRKSPVRIAMRSGSPRFWSSYLRTVEKKDVDTASGSVQVCIMRYFGWRTVSGLMRTFLPWLNFSDLGVEKWVFGWVSVSVWCEQSQFYKKSWME